VLVVFRWEFYRLGTNAIGAGFTITVEVLAEMGDDLTTTGAGLTMTGAGV
jgi:hypothetical protein